VYKYTIAVFRAHSSRARQQIYITFITQKCPWVFMRILTFNIALINALGHLLHNEDYEVNHGIHGIHGLLSVRTNAHPTHPMHDIFGTPCFALEVPATHVSFATYSLSVSFSTL